MGPNDECPDLKVSGNAGEEDVESNLLFPAGLRLSPAAFQLNVFQAEDLPRSESAGRVEYWGNLLARSPSGHVVNGKCAQAL